MNQELLRIVDSMARDKNIDRESILLDLEAAMASAARKHFGSTEEDVQVQIDRETGDILAYRGGEQIDIRKLGRIPAQTAKQVMIQMLREDERGSIYAEFQERVGDIAAGTVGRFEGGAVIVNLGRTEAILPRSEQIPGESYHSSERVRAIIVEVKEAPSQVKIILSRTHPDFIHRLFEQEVPEVAEQVIEIKALAREAGYRTKVAVTSMDSKVDAVGACVGVRGSRIKNIVDELGGEKIDIVRWNESSQVLIGNSLRPAEVKEIALCFELNRATVVVTEDQLSLAIGKRGQNVRLAARLTNWDIDILTPKEYSGAMEVLIQTLREIEGIDDTIIDKVMALGIVSVMDLEEVGKEPLMKSLELDESMSSRMVAAAAAEGRRQSASKEQASAAREMLAKEMQVESESDDMSGNDNPADTEPVIEVDKPGEAGEVEPDSGGTSGQDNPTETESVIQVDTPGETGEEEGKSNPEQVE